MSSVAMEEYEVMKDAKYRIYVSAVDKALKAFESTNEWHDLISALGKLNKVLKDNQRYPVIPRRIKISKRLAQCMHFALPSGVHLKALETYDTIFKCMGTNRLSHELFIYSAGLFPLFGHSAMNVKPLLLTIYETHFVPLGPRLRPGLSGFLSGVLPGLEEGSDHFDRTNSLLEKVCEGVGNEFFYSCLWECISCNSAIRLPAVCFVLSHFNKKLTMEDQKFIMGNDVNVMVNALCAGVQDTNVLVQRTSLDLLLVGFPMHTLLLNKASLVNLVTSAISTVLRRDMSLNRRLYSWLLGSDLNVSHLSPDHPFLKKLETFGECSQTALYFETYSKEYLIQGVRAALKLQNTQALDIRPYRLLMSLLDKQDVGPLILDDILYEVFRTLYISCSEDKSEGTKCKFEILKSANLLFSSLEPWYIWQYIGLLFDQACKMNIEEFTTILEIERPSVSVQSVGSGFPHIWEVCELCEFLLEVIPLEACGNSSNDFMLHLILHIVTQLTKYIETLSPQQIARSLKLCAIMLSKVHPPKKTLKNKSDEKSSSESEQISAGVIRSRVASDKNKNEEEAEQHSFPSTEKKTVNDSVELSKFSTLFKNFLKQYEIFYVTLVGGGRVIHSPLVPETFENMKKNPEGKSENDYAKELRRILTAVMNDDDTTEVFSVKRNTPEDDEVKREVAAEGNEKWEEAFCIASEILVELSSFPRVRVDFDLNENKTFLPWMKFVVVCACNLEKSPGLQLVAIKTLLDLLSLSNMTSSKDGTIGLLNYYHAEFLKRNTHVLEILGRLLWRHLGSLPYQFQVTCIELLHQLHGIFPSDESLERVLGEALLKGTENGQVEAIRRFIKLWDIGREIQQKDLPQKKLFHKCLLKLLDNLLLPENSPLKIETQTCLVQSLIKGDLPRLLDPVLLMLLDPATARMSILHVSIQHSNVCSENQEPSNQSDELGNKIYAISSVDGNVIYHVSNTSSEKGMLTKKLKWRWKKNGKIAGNGHQRVFAVTSLKHNGENQPSFVTKKNIHRDIELPSFFEGNISVLVNPFSRNFVDSDFSGDQKTKDWPKELSPGSETPYPECENKGSKNGDSDLLSRQPRVTLEVTTTEASLGELRFFGHLKNKLMDVAQGECDDTRSADEYFSQDTKTESSVGDISSSFEIVNNIIDSLVDNVVKNCENENSEKSGKTGVAVHPYHSHFLLYCGVYDSCRTLYAFNTLKNIMLTNPRLFLCCAATSGIANAPFSTDLLVLLARHKKSVFGRNFHGDPKSLNEYMGIYRSNMYLEILVSVCLHFARSYYPNLGILKLTEDEIKGNRQVQLTSVEILTHICNELIPIVRDSGKGFANYIADILSRCKVQKTILYCIMSSLLNIHQQQNPTSETKSFTEEILDFNDPFTEKTGIRMTMTEHSSAFQIQLLKVLQALIILEQQIDFQKTENSEGYLSKAGSVEGIEFESKYSPDSLIAHQPMFLKGVLTALSLKGKMRYLHYNWTELITSSLPYLGSALPQIVMKTINQICANIEELAAVYSNSKSETEDFPPGYAVSQLEALTILCHFCVLDSNQQISPQPLASAIGSNPAGIPGSNPAQILSNLVHVFTPTPLSQESNKCKNQQAELMSGVRRNLLANMPRVISSVAALWEAVTESPGKDSELCIWGNPKIVRNQILEFLSPISLHHGAIFLAAIGATWEERKAKEESKKVLPVASRGQQILVDLVCAIRVMPIDTLVQTIHSVVKQPPAIQGASPNVSLDVSILELFYIYMQTSTSAQLGESWNSLLALLRDGLLLAPPALFLVLAILNEFVQKSPPFQDKKNQRDLQDITSKLVEAVGSVAGACLEQKTWLGRNLAVKEDLDFPEDETAEGSTSSVQQYSVQAQLVLAQILASLLDVSYGSQEKDKVATLLTNLMYNITPYLKNHMPKNAASFAACSQLLANLSGFQYTRKAWKREVFELLLEPSLFQMEIGCLFYWTTIIDNLMTHDVTSFRDLMSKISMSQGGSYTLFSSREQEYEQRSQLLKRLAFVIFCSETDQYHKFMPNIQERLSEILRLPQVVPSVQAQVFFCFRILLLRMSSHHVISLWPIVISEMVQVFTLIEQELCTDSEEFSSHIKLMSALDSSWVANSNNGLHAHGHPHWLHLILAAAKLLDLAVLLPTHHLPQFQMYRWAFVSDPSKVSTNESETLNGHDFVPHVMRICRLMDSKFGPVTPSVEGKEGRLLLEGTQIDSLQQLHPFFASVGLRTQSSSVDFEALEKSILQDFLEKMSNKGSQ